MVTPTFCEPTTAAAAILAAMGKSSMPGGLRRLSRLAFGPDQRPAPWARLVPALRVACRLAASCWGLATLWVLPPRPTAAETIPDNQRRHFLIVLAVSPSMRLKDAGPNHGPEPAQARGGRHGVVFPADPGRDLPDVGRGLLQRREARRGGHEGPRGGPQHFRDLPMQYPFPPARPTSSPAQGGRQIAQPWPPKSTLLLLLSDGDTVPATGMPGLPASIADVLVVAWATPPRQIFIDGRCCAGRQQRRPDATRRAAPTPTATVRPARRWPRS